MTTETQAPDPDDAARAGFEAFCLKRWAGDRDAFTRKPDGTYWLGNVEFAWCAYQAALDDTRGMVEMAVAQTREHVLEELAATNGAQSPAPEGAEWAGAVAFIQHAQNAAGSAGAEGHWPDEFLAWYKPADWLGEHRAAAVFLGSKIAAMAAPAEHDDALTVAYMAGAHDARRAAPAPQAPAWRPIETAPKDGTAILAFWKPVSGSPASHCYGITEFVEGRWRNPEEDDDYYIDPTHWMPLPAAPQTKEPKA